MSAAFFRSILSFLTCFAFVTAPCSGQEPMAPKIIEKEHNVERSPPPNKSWLQANIGQNLVKREIVAAREDSRAVVQLSADRQLRVNANSNLMILPSLMQGAPLGLEIQKGEVYLHSRSAGAEISVKTPVVDGTPKGTQFRILVEEDGTTTFTMFEGIVELRNAHGNLTLGSNEQGIIEPGKAPRRTARVDAKNAIQWCLYYPGVIHLPELVLTPAERRTLAAPLAAYASGDLLGALTEWPAGFTPNSAGGSIFHASVLLSVGQVTDARHILTRAPADAPGRRAIEEMIDAVNYTKRHNLPLPRTASEWLARSYYEQSRATDPDRPRGDALTSSLAAARKALEISPEFGFAAVRAAELEFSFGRTRESMELLSRGIGLTPRNAQAYSLQGFLFADWNCIEAATSSFETAISLDGALGNAWLGRGLCKIRTGKQEEGRMDLQTAAVLEPNRSILHSYFGKASSLLGLRQQAEEDLEYAKKLDPADPTPWLYSALLHQEKNQPNKAIAELEKSIALNDNRRLYRSDFLLDQDRAVRSANLAKIYQYNGMREVAIREATRAVDNDYTNPSAHLFLANSFDALRDPNRVSLRYETPWLNELLLANLFSQVGGGPLSQFVSQQEYSKLLESDGIGGSIIGEWRSDSEIRSTASVFGTHGKVSYGIDAYFRNDDGERGNADVDLREIYGQFKVQVTPDDIFYFLGKWSSQENGDTLENYGNNVVSPGLRFEEEQSPGLLLAGWNHRWGPGSNTLFLGGRLAVTQTLRDPTSTQLLVRRDINSMVPDVLELNPSATTYQFVDPALRGTIGQDSDFNLIYPPDVLDALAPYIGSGDLLGLSTAPFDFITRREIEIYSAEIQHIQKWKNHTTLVGASWNHGSIDSKAILTSNSIFSGGFANPAADQSIRSDFNKTTLYLYDYWNVFPQFTLLGGVSWTNIDHPENFRNPPLAEGQRDNNRLSGKFGFIYDPNAHLTIRGLAASGMGGLTFDESVRLEPVQLAGFNQAYRTVISESIAGSVEAPIYEIYGLSFEGRLPTRTWWGATFNFIQEDVSRIRGIFTGYDLGGESPSVPAYFADGTAEDLDYEEASLSLTLNQLIGDEFAIGARYRITRSELTATYPDLEPLAGSRITDKATLQELSLFADWNSPSGWFAHGEVNGFHQSLDDDPSRGPGRSGDEFMQINAWIGRRFFNNQYELTAGVLNLTDSDYQLSPLNPYPEIVRDRTFFIHYRMNF